MILNLKNKQYQAEEEPLPRTSAHCMLTTPPPKINICESWNDRDIEASVISHLSQIIDKKVNVYPSSKFDSRCSVDDINVILNQFITLSNYSSNGERPQPTPIQLGDISTLIHRESFRKIIHPESPIAVSNPSSETVKQAVTVPKRSNFIYQQEHLQDDSMLSLEECLRQDIENFSPTFGRFPNPTEQFPDKNDIAVSKNSDSREQPSTAIPSPTTITENFFNQLTETHIIQNSVNELVKPSNKLYETAVTSITPSTMIENKYIMKVEDPDSERHRFFLNLESFKKKSPNLYKSPSKNMEGNRRLSARSVSQKISDRTNHLQKIHTASRAKMFDTKDDNRSTPKVSLNLKHANTRTCVEIHTSAINNMEAKLTRVASVAGQPSKISIDLQFKSDSIATKNSQASPTSSVKKTTGLAKSRTGIFDNCKLFKTERSVSRNTNSSIKHPIFFGGSAMKTNELTEEKKETTIRLNSPFRSDSRAKIQELIDRIKQPLSLCKSRSTSKNKTSSYASISAVKKTNTGDRTSIPSKDQPKTIPSANSRHLLPSSLRGMTVRFGKQKQISSLAEKNC